MNKLCSCSYKGRHSYQKNRSAGFYGNLMRKGLPEHLSGLSCEESEEGGQRQQTCYLRLHRHLLSKVELLIDLKNSLQLKEILHVNVGPPQDL